jgi:serine/threonine protein kinase
LPRAETRAETRRAAVATAAVWDDDDDAPTFDGPPSPQGRSLGVALPARVGRFVIRGLLGSGTHATVYRAHDPELDREVALKVPHAAVGGSRAWARFQGEARLLARLRHPGIVPVFETGWSGDAPFLATALIEGGTLAQCLESGPLDPHRAALAAAELAEALAYAHALGVVHRDVKPANVMFERTGRVQLADFGLALRQDDCDPARPGRLVGTPAYLAPELALSGGPARPEADQYGLGVVLYEMLCGRTPFLGPPLGVLAAAGSDDPIAPREYRPEIPRDLERICLRAMARRPEHRYNGCGALAADLHTWLARADAAAARRASARKAVAWLTKRPAAALSTAFAAIGLAASAVLAAALLAPMIPFDLPTMADRRVSR